MRAVDAPSPTRMHRAARTEDLLRALLNRWLLRRGGRPEVLPFAGYGSAGEDGWVRVLGRVLLTPPGSPRRARAAVRGGGRFLSAPGPGVPVTVTVAGDRHELVSGRDGYLDLVLPAALPPGRDEALVSAAGAP